MRDTFATLTGFEWDAGNSEKNWQKHRVSQTECEQVFFNAPLVVFVDAKHSDSENRFFLLGKTNENRLLTIVATVRGTKIRVISARDMSRNERTRYRHEIKKEDPQI